MLEIRDLHVKFHNRDREAVAGVSLTIHDGEILGLVGESGSGKSVTAMSVAGLLPRKSCDYSGQVLLDGTELLHADRALLRQVQGRDMGVVFQEPMTAMDPLMKIGHQVEEVLYPAMEDFFLDIVIGKGPAARSIRLDIPKFTLVGATTRTGLLTGPLRDRFGISYRLDYYTIPELTKIVVRSAGILGVGIDEEGAQEIASRSRGTPRLANRLLKRVRDYAQVKSDGTITEKVAREALSFFEIDELGLDWMDVKILTALCSTFRGRPVGLTTIASAVSEDPSTIEDVYEPYLLQCGLVIRTPQGRKATRAAFEHLGLIPPTDA